MITAVGVTVTVTVNDELEHVQNYLGIERERFGNRLQTRFTIDDGLRETSVPPLILFPVVENAIKHGIDSCLEGGTLEMLVRAKDNIVIIEVTNPVDELGRKQKGTGHGLSSVERRLRNFAHNWPLAYGLAAVLMALIMGWLSSVLFRRPV